jgi:hypothetical protein
MAALAYFADLPNGDTVEFKARRIPTFVDRVGIQRSRIVEPKVQRCLPTDGTANALTGNVLCGYVEGRGWTRITRTVEMKSAPSRHECDARCMNANGRTMNCECACGGANHGKGRFMCEAA